MSSMAVPMPPPGGSLIGRGIKSVLWSGVYGSLGGTIMGWIKGSSAGKVLGASIGAGSGMLGFGVAKGFLDKKQWNRYQWERYNYALQTGDLLPNLEVGRARVKRRAKNVVGVGLIGGGLVLAGLGPAMAAVPALAFWGAAVAGSYMLTRLAYRPKRPDFKGLAAKLQQPEEEPVEQYEEPDDLPGRPMNVPVDQSIHNMQPVAQPNDPLAGVVRGPGAKVPSRRGRRR